jgi:hypothetical protein
LQAVHQELPARDVLDLVEEEVRRIAVDVICDGDDVVEGRPGDQALVVEVDVSALAAPAEEAGGEERLAGSSRAGDDLDQVVVPERRGRAVALDVSLGLAPLEFPALLDEGVAEPSVALERRPGDGRVCRDGPARRAPYPETTPGASCLAVRLGCLPDLDFISEVPDPAGKALCELLEEREHALG